MMKLLDNPPILSPGVNSLTEFSGQWWVAHTKARFEKSFAWELYHRNIGYFLPMTERIRVYGGKKQSVMLPLFSSYVFFCGSEKSRYIAMTTNRLCQIIEVINQEKLITELLWIKKALVGEIEINPYPFAAVGQHCRITAGALEGIEGIVVERSKKTRFVLKVDILGQGAVIEIDGDLLEPVVNS